MPVLYGREKGEHVVCRSQGPYYRNTLYIIIYNIALLDALYLCAIEEEAGKERYNIFLLLLTNNV